MIQIWGDNLHLIRPWSPISIAIISHDRSIDHVGHTTCTWLGNIYRNAVIVHSPRSLSIRKSNLHQLTTHLTSTKTTPEVWFNQKSTLSPSYVGNVEKSNHYGPAGSEQHHIRTIYDSVKSSFPEPSTSRITKKLSWERYVYFLSTCYFPCSRHPSFWLTCVIYCSTTTAVLATLAPWPRPMPTSVLVLWVLLLAAMSWNSRFVLTQPAKGSVTSSSKPLDVEALSQAAAIWPS